MHPAPTAPEEVGEGGREGGAMRTTQAEGGREGGGEGGRERCLALTVFPLPFSSLSIILSKCVGERG